MPDAAPYVAEVLEEKLAILRRLAEIHATLMSLQRLLDEIEDKFVVKIYRSSLVTSYDVTTDGRQHVEYRVWAHSDRPNQYPREVLTEWMFKLGELFPPTQAGLDERLFGHPEEWGYEKDEEMGPDEITPPEGELDTVYGYAVYPPFYYLAQQVGDTLEEIDRGVDASLVEDYLGVFGVSLPEAVLHRRGVRHRARRR